MLRINNIRIKNFGPYYGEHNIAFPDANGVSIVWGYNGFGKTSIMRSFSYVLWGQILKNRVALPNHTFVNALALNEDGKMYVELDMSYDGHKYILTRGMNKVAGDGKQASDFENYCQMTCDGNVMLPDAIESFLDTALPSNIARFYLFDGELLSEYERLLDEQDQAGHVIKRAIEDILGLPILEHAKNNLDNIYQEYNRAAAAAAKKEKNTAQVASSLDKALEERIHKADSLKELQEKLDTEYARQSRLEDILVSNERYSKLIAERNRLRELLNSLNKSLQENKEKAERLVGDSWRSIINHLIDEYVQTIDLDISEIRTKNESVAEQKAIMQYLEGLLSSNPSECPICEHEMTNLERQAILNKIRNNGSELSISREDLIKLEKGESVIASLKKLITDDATAEIETIFAVIENIEDDINLSTSELKRTEQGIDAMGCNELESSILSIPKELVACGKNIKTLDLAISEQKSELEDIDATIAKYQNLLRLKSNNPDVALANAKSLLSNDLMRLFEEGISIFRNELKDGVEEDATEVFRSISHNPEYDSLSINDNFGLEILFKDGTKPPHRSSGYEQVVAISLILALHKNTPIGGPIFMDSTFQRIDPLHKQKLMECLAGLGNQIVILAFDQEMAPTKNAVRDIFGDSLKQEFTLKQISSLRTTIEREESWTI